MFVSSYSTFIPNDTTNKTTKLNQEKGKVEKSSFSSKLLSASAKNIGNVKSLPINYLLSNRAFDNKQELNYQRLVYENKEDINTKELTTLFTKRHSIIDAKTAYTSNSEMFSFLQEPKVTLSQTPVIDSKEPMEIQEIKEKNLRHTMVNTYLENDKYFQITA
ncbi:MAG: hypothetical protein U9P72_04405 [Campylobacterota bacterium]|nr:hypothetical protein [Campylobacterota bacterium]